MKRIFVFICLLLCCTQSQAQYTIKGVVTDTLNFVQLQHASVVVVRTSDSVIETFGRSGSDGKIVLNVGKEGKYILRVTFPGLADYVDVLTINKPVTDAGIIPMVSKERLLQEFVLTRQIAAIKIKGDTTEYVADSFKTKANATVEDLLKKLPGIQVNKDGKITAQGETVAKILVDGEEFFSDDPKVVTKGLQATAVDKVQVFDKKSDQAEFTGVDDGQKTKTINLELKDNMKKGYFGKIDAGGGTDDYYQEQGMLNAFKGKRQISVFGISSNTDKAGLGWNENNKFGGGGDNTVITDEGYSYTTTSSSDDLAGWDGKYNGQGLPMTNTGGAHFADKWDEDKNHFTSNYRYGLQGVDINSNTITQYVLPNDGGSLQREIKTQNSIGYRHGFDAMFERKIDSNTTLKISADAGLKHTEIASTFNDSTTTNAADFVNNNKRAISTKSDAQYLNADLLFRHKFAKKGRTISFDVKENYNQSTSNGRLNSVLTYLDTPYNKDTTTFTHQIKDYAAEKLAFSAKAIYTEPLSKTCFLDGSYGVSVNNSTAKNFSYDSANGVTQGTPDLYYSSNFKYNIFTNRGGVNFKYDNKKILFSFGSDISDTRYLQTDLIYDSTYKRDYLNLFPTANFRYKFAKQTSLNFFYQGSTQQPTIDQVQPLHQNTDPLNVVVGNPGLKQSFTNNFNLNFNDYKMLTGRYTYMSVSFKTINDAISTTQTILPTGNTTQYVNVNGNYSGDLYFNRGAKIKKTNLYVGLNLGSDLSHVHNFVNGAANVSDNNSYTAGAYLNYEKENKYSFDFNPQFTYNNNQATISQYANSYYLFNCDASATVQITKKLEFNSTVSVMIRERTAVFNTNNNTVRWNAYIGQKLLKNNQLELRLSVFDILNQNIGYSRTAQSGVITENTYNTIRRYGMLNVIWNFNHNPGGTPAAK